MVDMAREMKICKELSVKLQEIILALIPDYPDILSMSDAWDLFEIEEFYCEEFQHALNVCMTADATFKVAKSMYKQELREKMKQESQKQ